MGGSIGLIFHNYILEFLYKRETLLGESVNAQDGTGLTARGGQAT